MATVDGKPEYEGDEISIEELPNGCVVSQVGKNRHVVIASLKDAQALVDSLNKMIHTFSPDKMQEILEAAVSAIYFDDSDDYLAALWTIVGIAGGKEASDLLEENPDEAYSKYTEAL